MGLAKLRQCSAGQDCTQEHARKGRAAYDEIGQLKIIGTHLTEAQVIPGEPEKIDLRAQTKVTKRQERTRKDISKPRTEKG